MEMSQSYHVSVTLMTTWQALQGIKARVRCVPVCVCVCVCARARSREKRDRRLQITPTEAAK